MEDQEINRFDFKVVKAVQAIRWMLHIAPEKKSDYHTICKACFFADEEVLNLRGRPIFGDQYKAMEYGPVPLGIYEMLKCNQKRIKEMHSHGIRSCPWKVVGRYGVVLKSKKNLDKSYLRKIASAELEIIEDSFRRSSRMSFRKKVEVTHGRAWKKGRNRERQFIFYEDMLWEE